MGGDIGWNDQKGEFNRAILDADLEDLKYGGCQFTWVNKQLNGRFITSKIDRALINEKWLLEFPMSSASFLVRGPSDHSPIIVTVTDSKVKGKPFKFFDHWLENDKVIPVVKLEWNKFIRGSQMFRVCRKLRNLKHILKNLNKENIGEVASRVLNAKNELESIQLELDKNPNDVNLQNSERVQYLLYNDLLKVEESEMRQKTRVQWLEVGDKNSSFFFKCINNNRNRGRIHNILLPNGERTPNLEVTCEAFVDHFKGILGKPHETMYNGKRRIEELVRCKINDEQFARLGARLTEEEIKDVFWSLKGNKAPG